MDLFGNKKTRLADMPRKLKETRRCRPPIPDGERTVHKSFTLPPSLAERFRARSAKEGLSMSGVIRRLVESYVEEGDTQ